MDVIKYSMNLVLDEGPINDIYNKVREPRKESKLPVLNQKENFA